MQKLEVVKAVDTLKKLSQLIAVEFTVFTSNTQPNETVWFDVKG